MDNARLPGGEPPHDLKSRISRRLDPLDGGRFAPAEPGVARSRAAAERYWHIDDSRVNSAVLVPLVEREAGLSVILTRRADALRDHNSEICFPGGRRDPGETPGDTALREAKEEIGLDRSLVSLVGVATPYTTPTFKYWLVPVVGFVRPEFTPTPNPHEVAEVFEAPFAFLMDPLNYEVREGVTPLGEVRPYHAVTHQGRCIFGVTAAILRKLHERLFGEGPAWDARPPEAEGSSRMTGVTQG